MVSLEPTDTTFLPEESIVMVLLPSEPSAPEFPAAKNIIKSCIDNCEVN